MNKISLINKIIFKRTIESIMLLGLVIGTYFFWGTLSHIHEYSVFARTMANYRNLSSLSMEVRRTSNSDILMPVTNAFAMSNYEPMIIKITNSFNMKRNYNLVARITKDSTLDFNYINISIDDKIYRLRDLEKRESENNIYVIFPEGKVGLYKNLAIRIWLDARTPAEQMNKTLILTFELEEGELAPV